MQSVEVDAKADLCLATYDPERVTPEKMLETIKGTGFEGVIRPPKSGEGR